MTGGCDHFGKPACCIPQGTGFATSTRLPTRAVSAGGGTSLSFGSGLYAPRVSKPTADNRMQWHFRARDSALDMRQLNTIWCIFNFLPHAL